MHLIFEFDTYRQNTEYRHQQFSFLPASCWEFFFNYFWDSRALCSTRLGMLGVVQNCMIIVDQLRISGNKRGLYILCGIRNRIYKWLFKHRQSGWRVLNTKMDRIQRTLQTQAKFQYECQGYSQAMLANSQLLLLLSHLYSSFFWEINYHFSYFPEVSKVRALWHGLKNNFWITLHTCWCNEVLNKWDWKKESIRSLFLLPYVISWFIIYGLPLPYLTCSTLQISSKTWRCTLLYNNTMIYCNLSRTYY